MTTFGYVVSLRLDGRVAVVVGGGPIAAGRVRDLRDAGAEVRLVSPAPGDRLRSAVAVDPHVTLQERAYALGDLDGAAVAVATREDDLDVPAFWRESRDRGVLASVLDDLDHCDFAAPALVRNGDLRIAVATAGRAPALAKRLRRWLEQRLGPAYGDLVTVLADARAYHGPRDVPFDAWTARWEDALEDLDVLAGLVAAGRAEVVTDHVLGHLRGAPRPLVDRLEAIP